MAVQILHDMPDAAIHRGDAPVLLSDWSPRASTERRVRNRPAFVAITIGLHVVAALALLSVRHATRDETPPAPIVASILEAPAEAEEAPPVTPPPMQQVVYALPMPEQLSIDVETITPPPATTAVIAPVTSQTVAPPMVESVEYVRMPTTVYPGESKRRREEGTVLLRVLVDPAGRPAQILIERSSGFDRLDKAAQDAVLKALFRPHEVNGVAQAAQVLIPVEFGLKKRHST
jgi:protein TonB